MRRFFLSLVLLAGAVLPAAAQEVPQSRAQIALSFAPIVREAAPAVVNVYSMQTTVDPFYSNDPFLRRFFGQRPPRGGSALGSGVIVDPSGLVVTNAHVIKNASEIRVGFNDRREAPAELLLRDERTDLAVLKIEGEGPFPVMPLAPPASLETGDLVLAIGNPFGVGQTVTMGIVSALQRNHLGISTFENFIQTDAAINPGNSGGALVNGDGALVGINAAIYSRSGGSLGIGFAIPVEFARDVMEQIIRTGRVTRGWIGVEIEDLSPEQAASFGLPNTRGALISGVMRGGPADQAGIRPGDVLTAIADQDIEDTQRMLEQIAALPPGEQARFTLLRQGRAYQAKVRIGRRPTIPRPDE